MACPHGGRLHFQRLNLLVPPPWLREQRPLSPDTKGAHTPLHTRLISTPDGPPILEDHSLTHGGETATTAVYQWQKCRAAPLTSFQTLKSYFYSSPSRQFTHSFGAFCFVVEKAIKGHHVEESLAGFDPEVGWDMLAQWCRD